MKDYISGQFVYEIRFTKDKFKIKVDYNGNTKEWISKNAEEHQNFVSNMLKEVSDWLNDIDYGLNDCNCGEDNNEITEETK
jgi:hypothetical protein